MISGIFNYFLEVLLETDFFTGVLRMGFLETFGAGFLDFAGDFVLVFTGIGT